MWAPSYVCVPLLSVCSLSGAKVLKNMDCSRLSHLTTGESPSRGGGCDRVEGTQDSGEGSFHPCSAPHLRDNPEQVTHLSDPSWKLALQPCEGGQARGCPGTLQKVVIHRAISNAFGNKMGCKGKEGIKSVRFVHCS